MISRNQANILCQAVEFLEGLPIGILKPYCELAKPPVESLYAREFRNTNSSLGEIIGLGSQHVGLRGDLIGLAGSLAGSPGQDNSKSRRHSGYQIEPVGLQKAQHALAILACSPWAFRPRPLGIVGDPNPSSIAGQQP